MVKGGVYDPARVMVCGGDGVTYLKAEVAPPLGVLKVKELRDGAVVVQ